MTIDGFPFEGETVTARALKGRGMVYSVGAIQSALEAGCKTRAGLVDYIERRQSANYRRSYRQGAKALKGVFA